MVPGSLRRSITLEIDNSDPIKGDGSIFDQTLIDHERSPVLTAASENGYAATKIHQQIENWLHPDKEVSVGTRNPGDAEVGAVQEVSSAPVKKSEYVAPALFHLDGRETEGKMTIQTFEGGSFPTTHGPS